MQSLISWSGSLVWWLSTWVERQNLRNKSPFDSIWPETKEELDAGYKLEPRLSQVAWCYNKTYEYTSCYRNTSSLPWHVCRDAVRPWAGKGEEVKGVLKSCLTTLQVQMQWCLIWLENPHLASLSSWLYSFLSFLSLGFLWISLWKFTFCCWSFHVCLLLSSVAYSSKLLWKKSPVHFLGFLSQVWPKMLSG